LRYGELLTTHVRGYDPAGQTLSSPAWNRATLWTFILLPFQALFGVSIWTFVLPYMISLLIFGPVVYLFANQYFSRKVAFASAVAMILNPRILFWSTREDPGQPELLLIVLFILTIHCFLNRRWVIAGLLSGITVLTRLSGLIFLPLFALWLALFDRKALIKKDIYIYILVMAVTCAPYFIRNAVVFGTPFYSDQSSSSLVSGSGAIKYLMNRNVLDSNFTYQPAGSAVKLHPGISVSEHFKIIYLNSRSFLFGIQNGLGWYPGFFELLTLILTPFMFYGAWKSLRDPAKFMILLCLSGYLFSLIVLKMGYEDRYSFSVLPFGVMLAFYGVELISARFKRITVKNILVVFILMETLPHIGVTLMDMAHSMKEPEFRELSAVCQWVKRKTPNDAVLMTVPFWSPQYLCDRKTVPPSQGNLAVFKEVVEGYKVDYLMFSEFWGGDLAPRFTFMRPLLTGKYISLYKIDRVHPDFVNLLERYEYMKDFDLFGYFWKGHYEFQSDPPIFKVFYHLTSNMFAGGALFVMTFIMALWLVSMRSQIARFLGCSILVMVLLFCKLTSLKPISENMGLSPPVSKYQLEHFLRKSGASEKDIRFLGNGSQKNLQSLFPKRMINTVAISDGAERKHLNPERVIYFVRVPEKKYYMFDVEQVNRVFISTLEMNEEYEKVEGLLQESGNRPEPVAGGVLCITGH
jgi:hypothetical protein